MSCILERCALCQVPGIHISTQLDELCHSVQKSAACVAVFPVSAYAVSGMGEMIPSNSTLYRHMQPASMFPQLYQYKQIYDAVWLKCCRMGQHADPESPGSTDTSGLHHYFTLLQMKSDE